jgi:hypothetical protein
MLCALILPEKMPTAEGLEYCVKRQLLDAYHIR